DPRRILNAGLRRRPMARGATVRRFERPAILAGLAGALVAYLVAILWYSRFHLLDDSLIHLRLAELLLEHGFFTTDGYARSFGTSSPVFVAIAAALHHLAENDFTTKIISLFFYLVLVATLLGLAWRARA